MKSIKKKEMFAFLLVCVIAISAIAVCSAETFIYVPEDYAKIQGAVDNATTGDTIIVRSGTYYENVNVTRQLILRGVDTGGGKPVVDADGNGSAITLSADGITLLGFTATNASGGAAGITVTSNNNTITGNTVINNNWSGIYLDHSSNNTISDNNASNNEYGIRLKFSLNNTIANNNASNNHYYGIYPYHSSGNIITNNNASNNKCGIYLRYARNNIITNNTANNSAEDGIHLYDSDSNKIYLNNFVNNNRNVYSYYDPINIWNSTEPITYQYNGSSFTDYMGNYWSDYTGSDADGDGIGDTSYSVDPDEDGSPLMEPVEEYFKPIEESCPCMLWTSVRVVC